MDEVKLSLMEMVVKYLAPPLLSALGSLLVWVFWKLGQKLDAQASMSKLSAVGARISHLAESVAHELEATLKPELLKATEDGKLTTDEITKLRETALARLRQMIGEKGLGEVVGVLGIVLPSVNTYLSGVIEKAVAGLPKEPPSP